MDPRKSVIITNDPLSDLPIGSSVTFGLVGMGTSDAIQRPNWVKNWEHFRGAIVALHLKSSDSDELVGTAVIVAPGLAITASHNIADVATEMVAGSVVPYCFGIRDTALEAWKVRSINYDASGDMALLSIIPCSALPNDLTYYRMGITTRAPKKGENLHIIGFRQEGPTENRRFPVNLYAASGVVTAVYPHGRDRLLLPYPVIELNCGSLGGMSGGAAIDEHGLVVGIISRGLQTEDGGGPTYVSWIIRALSMSIQLHWPPGVYKVPQITPLSIDPRLLFIDRREALDEITEGSYRYQIWFEHPKKSAVDA